MPRRRVFFLVAAPPLRVDAFCFLVLFGTLTPAAFLAAAFFDTSDLAGAVRLTSDVVLVLAGFFFAARLFEVAALFGFGDLARDLGAGACLRLPVRVDSDRLRPTTLRTPGPGTRLDSSPVLHRTVSIEPFTAVTEPDRGPDLDVTSIWSPTTVIGSSSTRPEEYDPNRRQAASPHPTLGLSPRALPECAGSLTPRVAGQTEK